MWAVKVKRKRLSCLLLWPPLSRTRTVHRSLFVQCCDFSTRPLPHLLFSVHHVGLDYVDFHPLLWLEQQDAVEKMKGCERRCTFMVSSLIMSLQVGSFICCTGFDCIHPPRAWAQAFKGESGLWLRLLKLFWTRLLLLEKISEYVCKLERRNKQTCIPSFSTVGLGDFIKKLIFQMI